MKPQLIQPVWMCPACEMVYTDPGECEDCPEKLRKITPLPESGLVVFRCKICKQVTTFEPEDRDKHLWHCDDCGYYTMRAYEVSEQYWKQRRGEEDPAPVLKKPKRQGSPYRFTRSVEKTFRASNAVSRAAFKADQLATELSQRRPKDSDERGFIDEVAFDISRFNVRAQMIVEMVLVKSLLEEAGLEAFVPGALNRMLDARLGPRVEGAIPPVKSTE